ncbi:hypothetical protein AB8V91_07220 [Archangium violaceum]|uniref:hypothetical protein n=1 Tax=Archangium violaceum TaxID=83451 RepID=UPI0036D98524
MKNSPPVDMPPRRAWTPWVLLVPLLFSACATGHPSGGMFSGRGAALSLTPPPVPQEENTPASDADLADAVVYEVAVVEPGRGTTQPVPVSRADFQRAMRHYLKTDDRRTLALALAFGSVLEETKAALGRELDPQVLVASCMWTLGAYLALWLVPEPTTKLLAAGLSVALVAWLGVDTLWGLMDGWALMATRAHEATTFAELREAGEGFARVLGTDAARAMLLAVGALTGRTVGEVAARVRTLPGYGLASAQWRAQGGAAVLGRVEVMAAQEGALARAVAAVETVAATPHGPLAVVMLKKGRGGGTASGSDSSGIVAIRHRRGNLQVILPNGQRWHLPRGMSIHDIPVTDEVGDRLQKAVNEAVQQWGPHRLSPRERTAIDEAIKKGKYWLAHLLEREARGRFVHARVKRQFEGLLEFNHQGIDVVDLATGRKYEILAGTASNLAHHGRRMAGELFRMLTF